jgi:apolipoprotein D and lipocalin family protein
VKPVDDFRLEKYLGKWYEIARLDHSFERGLTRVTAEYSLREDGGIRVLNRGYSEIEKNLRDTLIAKAAARGFDTSKLIVVEH